jgi:hypothetical protein
MNRYFNVAKIYLGDQVDIILMYLVGDAKVWWRTRSKDDQNTRQPKIDTCKCLKQELKELFMLNNTFWLAYEDLKKLKQDNSVR